jgi:hypothetical protein
MNAAAWRPLFLLLSAMDGGLRQAQGIEAEILLAKPKD